MSNFEGSREKSPIQLFSFSDFDAIAKECGVN